MKFITAALFALACSMGASVYAEEAIKAAPPIPEAKKIVEKAYDAARTRPIV